MAGLPRPHRGADSETRHRRARDLLDKGRLGNCEIPHIFLARSGRSTCSSLWLPGALVSDWNCSKVCGDLGIPRQGDPSGFMDAALQASRSFKAAVKMRRVAHKGPRANLPNFQQSIREFEANHPAWFRAGYSEAGPLAPVPVPTMMLRNLEAQLGCRNTKRGVRWMQASKDTKALACPDASTSAPLTSQVFADFMMRQQMAGVANPPKKWLALQALEWLAFQGCKFSHLGHRRRCQCHPQPCHLGHRQHCPYQHLRRNNFLKNKK